MKSLWNLVALLAVIHIVAFVGGFAFLVQSGMLDRATAAELVSLVQEPPADRAARRAEAERLAAEEAAEPEIGDTGDELPATAEDRLDVRLSSTAADRERMSRLRRSVQDLREQLRREQGVLEAERLAFEADRAAFERVRAEITEREGAEQFRKALEVYEQMKAADTKQVFDALLAEGKQEEVVSYLSSMEARIRAKVMAEFVKDQAAPLAAELLEVLRTRGMVIPEAGDPGA